MIKDLGGRIATVWEGLRPITREMLVVALNSGTTGNPNPKLPKFSYDAHADWELSRLLSALDEQSKSADFKNDSEKLSEARQLADTCARVMESQSGSAEVFIQLAQRALRNHNYRKLDELGDRLAQRFSAGEIAEIIRQTDSPQIRAIAYETLATLPVPSVAPLLYDSLYSDIAGAALEQKAFEYESDEAREALDQFDAENFRRAE
ncbi:MAG TPA: hypothetical protein VEV84_10540 [Pyrinomonadaceae bacterium]|nr:hypothetical protein [Pyrinomonadaceae bacterium]